MFIFIEFFIVIINPLVCYYRNDILYKKSVSLWNFYGIPLGVGPLWFIEALLFFAFGYVIFRLISGNPKQGTISNESVPNNLKILFFILGMAIGSFIVRIWLPIGWFSPIFEFQYPFFVQYICLFIIGIMAYNKKWFHIFSEKQARIWKWLTAILYLIVLPAILMISIKVYNVHLDPFLGGFRWASFFFAIWYQLAGISMIITLTVLFRKRFNHQGKLAKTMSRSAYTVFIIHTPVLVFISLAFRKIEILPIFKFFILAPIILVVCFTLAYLITRVPYINRIV